MPSRTPEGYSGTPLARKLGIKPGSRVCLIDAPAGYKRLLAPIPERVRFLERLDQATDVIHAFTTSRSALSKTLSACSGKMRSDAVFWISWPKKTSKQARTDMSEDAIRELALPIGLVDVKVCAVDATWSGLKLVRRKELR